MKLSQFKLLEAVRLVCKKEKLCLFGRLVQFVLTGFQGLNSGVRILIPGYCSTGNCKAANKGLHGHQYVCFPYEQHLLPGRIQLNNHQDMEVQQVITNIPVMMKPNIYMT